MHWLSHENDEYLECHMTVLIELQIKQIEEKNTKNQFQDDDDEDEEHVFLRVIFYLISFRTYEHLEIRRSIPAC